MFPCLCLLIVHLFKSCGESTRVVQSCSAPVRPAVIDFVGILCSWRLDLPIFLSHLGINDKFNQSYNHFICLNEDVN